MKIKAYQIKDLIEKNNYSGYLVYGQNNGLVKEKIKLIYEFYQIKKLKSLNYIMTN